jgi:hypothetical protein
MKEPRYLPFCFRAAFVRCPMGALRFTFGMAAVDGRDHFLIEPLRSRKLGRWVLDGAFLARGLFSIGALVEEADHGRLSFLLPAVTRFRNPSDQTWPATVCGAIVSAVPRWMADKSAPVVAPAVAS